ncbi:hypothetical protein BDE02_03G142200 [Populus trichocarpa]|nr:hypothetical protein BDE02_03G142200 [Populus trichocarpa]
MKHTKDPFEAAYVEQEESPPESPITQDDYDTQTSNVAATPADSQGAVAVSVAQDDDAYAGLCKKGKNKQDEEEEQDNMDVELWKLASTADPDKMANMQAILAQFTEEQVSRYESFRRSALQKTNMKRLLVTIT